MLLLAFLQPEGIELILVQTVKKYIGRVDSLYLINNDTKFQETFTILYCLTQTEGKKIIKEHTSSDLIQC